MSNTKTNTFRITNSLSQQALVWPISDFMYAVKWDDQDDTKTLSKSTVDSVIKDGTWKVVTEEAEKELPDTFKFYYIDSDVDSAIYTYSTKDQKYYVPSRAAWFGMSLDHIQASIKSGTYIVVDDHKECKEQPLGPDVMNYCYEILSKVAPDPDEEYYEKKYVAATKRSTLEAIKEFVEYSDHYVVLEKDYYAVYREGEDDPYKCHSDESLISVMNALSVLDIHEDADMYYTLNLEGIA